MDAVERIPTDVVDAWVLPRNPPAADDQIILIKHCCLAGCDGALRRVQFYAHGIIFQWRHSCGCAGMIVTNFCHDFDWFGQLIERMPVAAAGDKFIAVERAIIADDDAIVFRVQFDNVNRLAGRNAETFALADGVKFNAVVMAEDMAVNIRDFAAMFLHKVSLLKEAAVIVVRHETDFHALFLVGGLEIAMPRHFARVALRFFAKRKNRARKLILPQRKKKITLILPQIASALEEITTLTRPSATLSHQMGEGRGKGTFNSCKMSRRNKIRAELVCAVNEPAELQILIAHHARIRRATCLVFVGEVLDDVLLEFRRLVNEVIRDVELVADGARVGDGLRAAALVLRAVHAILRPELERDADDLVALLDQKRRRRGGINSPAHAADDALTLLRIHKAVIIQCAGGV